MKKKNLLMLILSVLCLLCAFALFSCDLDQNVDPIENEKDTFNITYYVDGGTHNNPSTYTFGKEIKLNNAKKIGYSFIGWYLDDTYTTEVKAIENMEGDITLYAKYKIIEYKISYAEVEGAENQNPTTYTIESESIILSQAVKPGYDFVCWTLGGEVISEIPAGSYGGKTLTALWTMATYNIKYNNVDNNEHKNIQSYDLSKLPVALTDASRTGYIFAGWYTASDGGEKVTTIFENTVGNLELYAHWIPIEYTATFKANGVTVQEIPFTIETESILPPDVPAKEHYCDGRWENFTLKTENIIINAVYTPTKYLIAYENIMDANNINDVGEFTIESDTITLFPLQKAGYVFEGWYDGEQQISQIKKGSFGNKTLKAKWSLVTYKITYGNMQGIPNPNPNFYTIENNNIILKDVTRKDYIFDGWYNEKGEKVTEIITSQCQSIQITALWFSEISSIQELKNISSHGNYRLTTDLNLNGESWDSIKTFYGIFDGNGFTISHFGINGFGFFAENKGTIKNLGLSEFGVSYVGSWEFYVGGMVGTNSGIISNCYVNGSVSIGFNDSLVDHFGYAGGLVGYNTGSVERCYAAVNVNGNKTYMQAASIIACGGLIGKDENGVINSCYVTGIVNAKAGTYSSGHHVRAGGLVGFAHGTIANDCYTTCTVTAVAYMNHRNATSASSAAGGISYTGVEVTNCFTMGDIYSSGESRDGTGIYGYAGASRLCGGGKNSYYSDQQQVRAIHDGKNVYKNENATKVSFENLTSPDWIRENLGWSDEVWNLVEGKLPTLKYCSE